MGLLTKAFSSPARLPVATVQSWAMGGSVTPANNYQTQARAYSGNELVYAIVNMLSNSAGEPPIIGRRNRRNRAATKNEERHLARLGVSNVAGYQPADALLIQNGFIEELPSHPLVILLNHPNPFMDGGQLFATITMDRKLAGNGYVWKCAANRVPRNGAETQELWRLRPDRVKVVPSLSGYIDHYEYMIAGMTYEIPAADIWHTKERNPNDDYKGLSPLSAILERVDIDNTMRRFLFEFFDGGGTGPGSILSLDNVLDQEAKDDIRNRMRHLVSGHFHEMLVFDNTKTTYQQLGLNRGLRDALPAEIDHQNEARITMAYGIPGSILGTLIGYESSSYANKRQDWQVFWDIVMTPLLSDYGAGLTRSFAPEYPGIDEVLFDLSQIRALQEDVDAIHDRARKNVDAGLWTIEEGRTVTGLGATPNDGEHILVPTRATIVPTPIPDFIEHPPTLAPVSAPPADEPASAAARIQQVIVDLLPVHAATRGRPRLENDESARSIWLEAERIREQHPRMTVAQIAARIGIAESTYYKYRETFKT